MNSTAHFFHRVLLFIGFILFLLTGCRKEEGPTPDQHNSSNIFYNNEDLVLWRSRIAQGVYVHPGDVSQNSPGDWERIVAYASKLGQDIWPDGPGKNPSGESVAKSKDIFTVCAAFKALIEDDGVLAENVRAILMAHANNHLNDFTDQALWPSSDGGNGVGNGVSFMVADVMFKLIQARWYIDKWLSSEDREKLDNWFQDFGGLCERWNVSLFNARWLDREERVMTGSWNLAEENVTHVDGYSVPKTVIYTYNNRTATINRTFSAIACQYKNDTWKELCRLYFEEAISIAFYPDGTSCEHYRGNPGYDWCPGETGFYYASILISDLVEMAEAFYRSGDHSLYDYNFKGDLPGSLKNTSLNDPLITRNLDWVVRNLADYNNDKFQRMSTYDNEIINSYRSDYEAGFVTQMIAFIHCSKYYDDPYLKNTYLRIGYKPYPKLTRGGWGPAGQEGWGGTIHAYPGVMLMFDDE